MAPKTRNEAAGRGFALVLSLVAITLLAVAALELSREAKLAASLAGNFRDRTSARMKALDGLSLAARALLDDDQSYDSLEEPWTGVSAGPGGKAENRENAIPAEVELTDLGGRLNLNLLVDQKGQANNLWVGVFRRLIDLLEHDPDLVQALLDWLDPDNEPRSGGGEAREYGAKGSGFAPRNGPLLDIDELGLVRGFNREVLEGNEEKPGLLELVAVHGGQRINVNTAPPLLLQALDSGFRETVAQAVVELREERPIRKVNELKGLVGIGPDLYRAVEPMLDVKSGWFRVESLGRSGTAGHRLRAVLRREKGRVSVAEARIMGSVKRTVPLEDEQG